ncbi:MAG: hypothetical protein ACE5OR_15840 [bacterium]
MKKTWVHSPKPVQLDRFTKDVLLIRVKEFVASSERLTQVVNRIAIRAGRIYLYHLVKAFIPEGVEVHLIKPLIEGKYNEFPLARITLYDKKGDKCTVDWQRHTGQWITLHEGSLDECLQFIRDDKTWFYQAGCIDDE